MRRLLFIRNRGLCQGRGEFVSLVGLGLGGCCLGLLLPLSLLLFLLVLVLLSLALFTVGIPVNGRWKRGTRGSVDDITASA